MTLIDSLLATPPPQGTSPDRTQTAMYGLRFENEFLKARGAAFEVLFARVMAARFMGNFQTVRPYGQQGDLKCDGFLSSDGVVFQCYGPRTQKLNDLKNKINTDMTGALKHWQQTMRHWVLVHNDTDGLPAEAVQVLAHLQQTYPAISIEHWSYPELRALTLSLPAVTLEGWYGIAPTDTSLDRLDFTQLKLVLDAIARQPAPPNPPVLAPSPAKLNHNALSGDVAGLLAAGRRKEKLVETFIHAWPDMTLGEDIAEGFRNRYQALKAADTPPDQIFEALQTHAGGMKGTASHQAAVLAVLSYYFERCDIFDDAPDEETP